jgi:hypothetical protein
MQAESLDFNSAYDREHMEWKMGIPFGYITENLERKDFVEWQKSQKSS